ncbi:hypothetical protein CFC21_037948 [Triticum aestivum]|uniref:F-box domain-containing protein n=2 Tax=Triticum aestivum TaxID=4565 RepID=A0A3B6EQT7_WHEAT|nr:F-box protein At5g49610-like [Triticum aestivum]KAF7025790.1 hypothetical protein CFC21_037948 [Triticum aestivum]
MATAAATPPHGGLPEEVVVWEILVRLPPKSLLRCRAVCRAWRSATSARDFLAAHHARQPNLPIAFQEYHGGQSLLAFDNRGAAAAQLQPVARLDDDSSLEASCDGLLLLTDYGRGVPRFCVCNPATRQFACLPTLSGFVPLALGMYRHGPTGEYRVLVCPRDEDPATDACYIFALGSVHPLKNIGWLPEVDEMCSSAVLSRGSLHWHLQQYESAAKVIMAFDTTAESFRRMRGPVVPSSDGLFAGMFEMDGILGVACSNDKDKIIGIWMMQDYESEVWTLKYRFELPFEEIKMQCDMRQVRVKHGDMLIVVVPDGNCELLVLSRFGNGLFQINMDGKLVGSFYREDLCLTQLQLKQTLVPHTFFPALEGYVVNAPPFI